MMSKGQAWKTWRILEQRPSELPLCVPQQQRQRQQQRRFSSCPFFSALFCVGSSQWELTGSALEESRPVPVMETSKNKPDLKSLVGKPKLSLVYKYFNQL